MCALLERSGLSLYATALREDTVSLERANLGRCAVIIGSEGRGVSQGLLECSGQTIRIPMRSRCESLNAAAAASIVLWEMVRQGGWRNKNSAPWLWEPDAPSVQCWGLPPAPVRR